MARSRRHEPIIGVCGGPRTSEKLNKRWHNRNFRARTRRALQNEHEALPMNIRKETEIWDGVKDGKMRFAGYAHEYPQWMRK